MEDQMGKTNKDVRKDFDVAELYNTYKTHSGVFRYLHSQGLTMYRIAQLTGKRPQHVRNVLVTPLTNKS
jgi:hypothetical protein